MSGGGLNHEIDRSIRPAAELDKYLVFKLTMTDWNLKNVT